MKKVLTMLLVSLCFVTGYSATSSNLIHVINDTNQTVVINNGGTDVVLKPYSDVNPLVMTRWPQLAEVSIDDTANQHLLVADAFRLFLPKTPSPCGCFAYPVGMDGGLMGQTNYVCSIESSDTNTYYWLTFSYPEGPDGRENKKVIRVLFYPDLPEDGNFYSSATVDIPIHYHAAKA